MKFLFHLGHPAHFHLFKNVILKLNEAGHSTVIMIKKKDVLEDLLSASGLDYINVLPKGRGNSKLGLVWSVLKTDLKILFYCIRNRPNYLVGTSIAIGHVGKLLGIPNINVNEDDADVVPLYSKLSYPWATHILSPVSCDNGKWEGKSVKYPSYHELAYLHPLYFTASKEVALKYVNPDETYFILRFAQLTAHHDEGINGISDQLAIRLIDKLEEFGKVYITSERKFAIDRLEAMRIKVEPIDMHHVMSFARMYMGDSQTMAAEAGVLGVPFIRYNDFVGKIGYLRELEEVYELGKGISPEPSGEVFLSAVDGMLAISFETFAKRRKKLLSEKISLTDFLFAFLTEEKRVFRAYKENPIGYFKQYP